MIPLLAASHALIASAELVDSLTSYLRARKSQNPRCATAWSDGLVEWLHFHLWLTAFRVFLFTTGLTMVLPTARLRFSRGRWSIGQGNGGGRHKYRRTDNAHCNCFDFSHFAHLLSKELVKSNSEIPW